MPLHSTRIPARTAVPRTSFLIAASLAAMGAAMSAGRAQQAPGTAIELEPVIVQSERGDGPVKGYIARKSLSGTKTDTPIERTPQSIAVVPRAQMDDQEVNSVAEALRYTPGVLTEYRGASNLRDEVFVRGFYYSPRYLDGMLLGNDLSYAKIYPQLLERVELLSGPSSILYGQMNPGGLVNMVSKKPTETPLHTIEILGGSKSQIQGAFDFSDKVPGSDTLSYRLTGFGLRRDLQENYARQEAFGFAPSLSWTPDDRTRLTVLGGYQYEPKMGFRNFLDAAGTIYPLPGYGFVPRDFYVSDPDFEKAERRQAWVGYEFERALNDTFTIRQKARYHRVDWTHHTLVWGSSSVDPQTGEASVSRIASGGEESWDTFTVDNQVQAKFATGPLEHTLLGGFDYRYMGRNYLWGYGYDVPPISLNNPVYRTPEIRQISLGVDTRQTLDAKQMGVYLQDQIEIGRLNLLAGLRWDRAETDIDDKLASNADHRYSDNALSWRVGAIYNFDNGLSPYVSYSTSFDPALYAPPTGSKPFDPTTGEQVEAGLKYAPPGWNMLLTAAVYDIRQKNVVDGEWDPAIGQTVYRQIGEIHNRGVELSARSQITDNLTVLASYAYIDSEITDSLNQAEIGKTPARVPEHQASLWSTYAFSDGALRGLTLGGGVRYIGSSWGSDTDSFQVPATTLFDAMLKYDLGALRPSLKGAELQVNAKNLADKRYVASCANAYACFYGEGRSITASLKYTW